MIKGIVRVLRTAFSWIYAPGSGPKTFLQPLRNVAERREERVNGYISI